MIFGDVQVEIKYWIMYMPKTGFWKQGQCVKTIETFSL